MVKNVSLSPMGQTMLVILDEAVFVRNKTQLTVAWK